MHRTTPHNRILALTTIAFAVLAVSPAAQATGARELSSGEQRTLTQRPLIEAAEVLYATTPGLSGYAGITLTDTAVNLWWKGIPPAATTAALQRAVRHAPVHIRPAAHSEAELDHATTRLRSWLDQQGESTAAIKTPGDGSGLVVSDEPGATTFRSSAEVTGVAGVPVRVLYEEQLKPVSRQDDSPPWSGGARTWNQTASTICTSGFGVRNGAGRQFVLTAEHCGQVGHRIADGRGELIGNTSHGHDDHDIGLVPASQVSDRMYVGGRDSNTTEHVVGWGHVFVGQYLCQSGVTSAEQIGGPVCDLKVLFFWQDREDLVEVEQQQGQPGARGGDSGGSVYSHVSGGVRANGTVTRAAGPRMAFQDFATAACDFGVDIP
ncbi:hypothetical protein GCM10011609_34030 [Lentzea pudingi]|uniref:Streptogrisin C n=1 Tax=Lentzea pudingi TaxID=1789439 RepID=A0ABQ2HWP4_9PSEU|nr:hypothetical protein [Lentzea pudingi]GGM93787.1 hypothetical protein GCM10011609_34030 [Lentzea pudingi]